MFSLCWYRTTKIVTPPNTAYGHNTVFLEKLMTINPPVNMTAVSDAKDTYRQIPTNTPHKASPARAPRGVITRAAPNAGATPRPPLNLAKMGQLCPAIAARPEVAAMAGYWAPRVLLDINPIDHRQSLLEVVFPAPRRINEKLFDVNRLKFMLKKMLPKMILKKAELY